LQRLKTIVYLHSKSRGRAVGSSLGSYPPAGGHRFELDRLLAVFVPATSKAPSRAFFMYTTYRTPFKSNDKI